MDYYIVCLTKRSVSLDRGDPNDRVDGVPYPYACLYNGLVLILSMTIVEGAPPDDGDHLQSKLSLIEGPMTALTLSGRESSTSAPDLKVASLQLNILAI
jgi:hypothetical protein